MRLLEWFGPAPFLEKDRIPGRIPGVYLLHSFDPTMGGHPVIYAGRAVDLRRRLTEHQANVRLQREVRASRWMANLYFSAAPVLDPHVRAGIESALIRILEPACNRQVPSAHPILVNLPPLHVFPLGGTPA